MREINPPWARFSIARSRAWELFGIEDFAAFTDEAIPPIEAERFYRDLEPALARDSGPASKPSPSDSRQDRESAQRILAQTEHPLVKSYGAIASATSMPPLSQRPDWPSRCSMRVGAHFEPCCSINAMTQACGSMKSMKRFPPRPAACVDSRAGPKGRKDLGIRGWQCTVCGAIHDRNVNAAHIILAADIAVLQKESRPLKGEEDVNLFGV